MPDGTSQFSVAAHALEDRVTQAEQNASAALAAAQEARDRPSGPTVDLAPLLERLGDLEAGFASTGQELHALEVSLTNLRARVRELEGSTGPEEPERPTDPPPGSGGIQDRPGRLKVDQAGLTVFDGWDKVYRFDAGLAMLKPGDVAEYQSEELRGYYSRIEPRGDTAPYSTPLLDLTSGEPDKPITLRFPKNFRHIGWELQDGSAPHTNYKRNGAYYPALLYIGGWHHGTLLSDWVVEGYSPRGSIGMGLKMPGVRMTARLGYGYRCQNDPFNLGGEVAALWNGGRFDAEAPLATQLYGQFNEDRENDGDSCDGVVKVSHSKGGRVEWCAADGGSDDIVDGIGASDLTYYRVFGQWPGYYHTVENGTRSRVEAPAGNGMGVKAGGSSSDAPARILVEECGIANAKRIAFTTNGAPGVLFRNNIEVGAGSQSFAMWCYADNAIVGGRGTRKPLNQGDKGAACDKHRTKVRIGEGYVEDYRLITANDVLSANLARLTSGEFLTLKDATARPFGWTSEQLGKFVAIEEHFGIKIGTD